MTTPIILNEFPEINEFYKTYWGKKPFIVKGAIKPDIFDSLIDGDGLAGLSLDEDVKSRLVITEPNNRWKCYHGPFQEDKFSTLGDSNWSLLVQNVDQFHPPTAQLLKSFNFSPRWLMDDIMVSYSTVGGSVGAHMDSYHVFLVQGKGKRKWKVSDHSLEGKEIIDNSDLQIFKDGFEGLEAEVSIGDVIYIPPYFGHQGITKEESLTFSIGFLGPKLSEILSEYSYFLENNPELNKRYTGQGLNSDSAKFSITPNAINMVQESLVEVIKDDQFSAWIAGYFSTSTHDEFHNMNVEEDIISSANLLKSLKKGQYLRRPEHVKIAATKSTDGSINLSSYGENIIVPKESEILLYWLNENHKILEKDLEKQELLELATELYNKGILCLE